MAPAHVLSVPEDPPSKREIVRSALHLFVERGLPDTSIRAIALAAGYTNPALYKFFASKEELALHVFERCYAWVYAGLAGAIEDGDFDTKLRSLVEAWAGLCAENLDAALYANENLRAFWPQVRPGLKRRSLMRQLSGLLEQGQREGVVAPRLMVDLGVALIIGTQGQVARQLYFGALEASLPAIQHQLHALLHAALTRSEP